MRRPILSGVKTSPNVPELSGDYVRAGPAELAILSEATTSRRPARSASNRGATRGRAGFALNFRRHRTGSASATRQHCRSGTGRGAGVLLAATRGTLNSTLQRIRELFSRQLVSSKSIPRPADEPPARTPAAVILAEALACTCAAESQDLVKPAVNPHADRELHRLRACARHYLVFVPRTNRSRMSYARCRSRGATRRSSSVIAVRRLFRKPFASDKP